MLSSWDVLINIFSVSSATTILAGHWPDLIHSIDLNTSLIPWIINRIPAAGILLIIQGVSEVFRSILCIQSGQWPARMVVAEETEKILMRTSQEEDTENAV